MAEADDTAAKVCKALQDGHDKRAKYFKQGKVQKYALQDTVWVERHHKDVLSRHRQASWYVPGVIVRKVGQDVYAVRVGDNKILDRDHTQFRPRAADPSGRPVTFEFTAGDVDSDDEGEDDDFTAEKIRTPKPETAEGKGNAHETTQVPKAGRHQSPTTNTTNSRQKRDNTTNRAQTHPPKTPATTGRGKQNPPPNATRTQPQTQANGRKPSAHSPGTEAARAMQVTRPNEIRSPGVRLHPKASAALGLEAERATPKRLGTLVPRTCMHALGTGYARKSGEPLGFRPKEGTCASTGAHPPGETSTSRWRRSALPV